MDRETVGNYVLLVGMATMFNQANGRLDSLNGRIDALNVRMDRMQARIAKASTMPHERR